jgi:hypothetical protein
VKRVHVALGRGLVEAGIGQQLLDLAVAGDSRVLDATRVADDLLAVGVGAAAAALLPAGEVARSCPCGCS